MKQLTALVNPAGEIERLWEQDTTEAGPVKPPPRIPEDYRYVELGESFDLNAPPSASCVAMMGGDDLPFWAETATLDDAKAQVWGRIKSARDQAEASDFTCAGLVYKSDMARISGAALAALMAQIAGAAYSIDWTLSDDSVATLNAAQMSAVGLALMQHVEAVFSIARELRSQIEAAATIAEVNAITWP